MLKVININYKRNFSLDYFSLIIIIIMTVSFIFFNMKIANF